MTVRDERARAVEIDRKLIDRFNADARPLSSEALDSLRARLLSLDGPAGEAFVKVVLAKLTNSAPFAPRLSFQPLAYAGVIRVSLLCSLRYLDVFTTVRKT
jgi:hypothetical protein